jgi:tRNA-dihydrouridine synthase
MILDHFRLIQRNDADEPKAMMGKLRTFTGWYTHGLPSGRELRCRIQSLPSPDAFLEAVEEFFAARRREAA